MNSDMTTQPACKCEQIRKIISRKGLHRFHKMGRLSAQQRNSDSLPMRVILYLFIVSVVYLFAVLPASAIESSGIDSDQFRIGFSMKIFSDVKKNDAMAALKVWLNVLVNERNVSIDPMPCILDGVEAMGQAMRNKTIDSIALSAAEYWKLSDLMDAQNFIVTCIGGSIFEEYVLLVNQDSGINRIEDLRGCSLIFFNSPRMSLASVWMDTILAQRGLPPTDEFCRTTHTRKLSQAVLPVFFDQIKACVTTRRGYKTMCELNPQTGQRLKEINSSPELVPGGFCFRKGYNNIKLRETIMEQLSQLSQTPAGKQILTIFQGDLLKAAPISCLDSSLNLLATHERLCGKTSTGTANKAIGKKKGETE